MQEDWKNNLRFISKEKWSERCGVDPFLYSDKEEDAWETIIPITAFGRTILLKSYVENVQMLKTSHQFDHEIPADTEGFVALFEHEVAGDIEGVFPDSIYLDRMDAERRIFELRGEWNKKRVLVDVVKIEDNGDHVETKILPPDWYKNVKPKFKVRKIIINPSREENEKDNT